MKVEVIAYGQRQIEQKLIRWGFRAAHLEPLWESVHEDLKHIEDIQFETEGHGEWPQLAFSTKLNKVRRGFDPSLILRATDKLFNSLTEDGEGAIWEVSRTGWRFGTSVPYAKYHHEGTEKMPRRQPIKITPAERKALVKKINWYIIHGEIAALEI